MRVDYVFAERIVREALEDDAEVSIELDDEYGWHIVIDGERLTGFSSEGVAWEFLNIQIPSDVAGEFLK